MMRLEDAIERTERTQWAIEKAWSEWLAQHPVSLSDIITDAIRSAVADWLTEHSAEVREIIERSIPRKCDTPDTD